VIRRRRAVASPKAAEGHQACEGARVANDEGARIEVLKALRSDMEATKVLNRVESGEGVENVFWHTFWSQNTSG